MAKITGLIPRGGKFALRLYVPKDLIPSFDGKKELVEALGTGDAILQSREN